MRAFLILLFPLAACAAPQPADKESRFEREIAGRIAGEPRSCVSAGAGRNLTIGDRGTLVYRSGDTIWVNRLDRGCPGLRPLDTLLIHSSGSQYCRGDRVQALQAGRSIPGAPCLLGEFVPYRPRTQTDD